MSAPRSALGVAPGPLTPLLEPEQRGVVIRVEARVEYGTLKKLHVHGAFQIDAGHAQAIGARPLHKALFAVMTSGYLHRAWNLAGATILFEDDDRTADGRVRGCFDADLLPFAVLDPFGAGWLLVGLGPFLSNVEAISAR